jgi:hypothetical protein
MQSPSQFSRLVFCATHLADHRLKEFCGLRRILLQTEQHSRISRETEHSSRWKRCNGAYTCIFFVPLFVLGPKSAMWTAI